MFKALGLLFALTLVGVAAAPSAGAAERLRWQACDEGFECATAHVPRDYARPGGAQIRLALIRKPASDRAHRIGSLFMNPGGPGASAIDLIEWPYACWHEPCDDLGAVSQRSLDQTGETVLELVRTLSGT